MVHQDIKELYDAIGIDYLSKKHRTVRYFNAIQCVSIINTLREHAWNNQRCLEELDVLNIGVGNGQHRGQLCGSLCDALSAGERVLHDRMTDFDISEVMLQSAFKGDNESTLPRQVLGDAVELSGYFAPESFDIALAALCDHIKDQKRMYAEVLKVLRPGGVFIVTYPHKGLMTTIRRDIYGIDPAFTRFTIENRNYTVPAYAPLPEDVEDLFHDAGFKNVVCKNLYHSALHHHDRLVSDTVRKAGQIIGKSVDEIPILVMGVGTR
jgi:SAM-dependent methyltransferase